MAKQAHAQEDSWLSAVTSWCGSLPISSGTQRRCGGCAGGGTMLAARRSRVQRWRHLSRSSSSATCWPLAQTTTPCESTLSSCRLLGLYALRLPTHLMFRRGASAPALASNTEPLAMQNSRAKSPRGIVTTAAAGVWGSGRHTSIQAGTGGRDWQEGDASHTGTHADAG